MANIIVAFSKPEDGKSIKGILVRSGYEVAAVCMSGSQVLSAAEDLSGGIVVCGYRFEDMMLSSEMKIISKTFSDSKIYIKNIRVSQKIVGRLSPGEIWRRV